MSDVACANHVLESNLKTSHKIAYIFGLDFLSIIQHLPKFGLRAGIVHNLIQAYGLLKSMTVIAPKPLSEEQLKTFHSEDFVDFLKSVTENNVDDFGIGYDCPVFENLFTTVCAGAGATFTAACSLISKDFTVAINWSGGWHHAKKDEASGFCYVNDIVLGILKLRSVFDKVLYVDLDLHHGDGVEEAFSYSRKVFCFSVHKYDPGFFPCTGSMEEVGNGKGRFYTMNMPLKDGICDDSYTQSVLRLLRKLKEVFEPDVVVLQFGADTLVGDPFNCFNLTPKALGNCLDEVLTWKLPLLVLGGGGYNNANTARCWTYLTSILCNIDLEEDIPDHENLLLYGPGYELSISPGNRCDRNAPEYLDMITTTLINQLQYLKN